MLEGCKREVSVTAVETTLQTNFGTISKCGELASARMLAVAWGFPGRPDFTALRGDLAGHCLLLMLLSLLEAGGQQGRRTAEAALIFTLATWQGI